MYVCQVPPLWLGCDDEARFCLRRTRRASRSVAFVDSEEEGPLRPEGSVRLRVTPRAPPSASACFAGGLSATGDRFPSWVEGLRGSGEKSALRITSQRKMRYLPMVVFRRESFGSLPTNFHPPPT